MKVGGLKEVIAQVKAVRTNLEKKADAVVMKNVQEMTRNAKKDAPKDMGRLAGDITNKKVDSMVWTMIAQSEYAPYLEFGTKRRFKPIPGIDASEFKGTGGKAGGKGFYDNILKWVKRKGISGVYSVKTRKRVGSKLDKQLQDEQAAFAIYLSIMRNGIKPQPYFFKQMEKQKPILEAQIAQLLNEQHL